MTLSRRLAAVVAALALGIVVVEAAYRLLDGYRIASTTLQQSHVQWPAQETTRPGELVRSYVRSLPVADGVRREWFEQAPDPLARAPLPPDMAAVAEQIKPLGVSPADMFKLWNTRYIHDHACGDDNNPFFRHFPGFAFAFDPTEPTNPRPPYRFLPSFTSPDGLVTNRFRFRGREIAADKPARTVRVAFAGASTTIGIHSQTFSYPEFVERWLNLWAEAEAPGVRFEVINAGREGFSSGDIAAVVQQELAPLEPDLIVYYEGSNQFAFRDLIEEAGEPIGAAPDTARRPLPGRDRSDVIRRLDIALERLSRRAGVEPPKPRYRLHWPESVDETHPDPDSPALPAQLPQIVHDLDDIRRTATTIGAKLVMTSFTWVVKDGTVVDPIDHPGYLQLLNQRLWPARYSDIRRLTDFQNRVFRGYARARALPFIDVSSTYPQDMTLFSDAIHTTPDGDRLRGWVMFQGLVPILRAELAAGRLPRPDREPYHAPAAPATLSRSPTDCSDYRNLVAAPGAFPLDKLVALYGAELTGTSPRRVETPALHSAYAAELPIANWIREGGPGIVRWRVHVRSGRVALGVMKAERASYLTYRTVDAGPERIDFYLQVDSLADGGLLMISNALKNDGVRSVVEVDDIALLRHGASAR